MAEEKETSPLKSARDLLLGLLAPAYGYLVAYQYQKGICFGAGIPDELIEVSIIQIIIVSCIYIVVFSALFMLSGVYQMVSEKASPAVAWRISFSFFYLTFMYVIIRGGGYPFYLFLLPLFIIFILDIVDDMVLPLLRQASVKGYLNKLRADVMWKAQRPKDRNPLSPAIQKMGEQNVRFAWILFMVFVISFFLGSIAAKEKASFIVLKTDPELIVLTKYGDNLVCATFDRAKKQRSKQFFVKSMNQLIQEKVIITTEDLGRLKIVK